MNAVQAPEQVRHLDRGVAPIRYARGWHCLGVERQFADGKPHGIEAFGTKLVVWADSKGDINVIDGYCRHMGGDLTQGSVKGDEVACPFHDWRWGGDGKCKAIPYARRVPLRARTQKYPVVIRNGQVLIWHDPEGSEPDLDILPPELPGIGTDAWTDWFWEVNPIEGSHCRELIDNVVDMAHFYYVHLSFPTSFRNVFEGTQATQFMESKGRPDVSGGYGATDMFLKSEATYYGPAYMINWLWVDYKGFETEVVLINCHLPTGPDSFTLQYGIAVRKPEGLDEASAQYVAKKYADMFGEGFLQDVHIWKNKVPVQNPLLCEEDGPVYQLRRWYEQFYVDVADIEPEMVERFEFEVDTTMANVNWEAEVAENLRRRAEEEEAAKQGADAGAGA
ncbi:Rieske 2Fe-2S domain-containing protein [Nocardioides massiliensis]|uniref:Rieske-type oxygenase n=1 Tax=Nocardioides massiliensis TaxID=1325935 RepID=A0ABT9NS64_9ACTN|nr:Rieske 2Fe-2S domain-containing protein [Nocardioides massiliensis]MDP9823141.1 3-ketosteroid 9alpha-monooxygenase subunit A [Nocardioides massiliensis]